MIGSITMDKFVGKRLDGRYEIREMIGVGGMANVYKAYDCIEDRIVAVKILKEEFIKNEEFISRFKNESKAIAVLNHPNIVKVYDVSFGDLIQYIVMEHVDGITLKEYINKQGSLRWKDAVYLTIQVLRALQHAHDKGIVHRDVKPQNIMLLADGTIKVADFGIARFARSEHKTMTDKAIGSVHYISPEQAKGEVTDEKADIYSVGVMLYEMLTGKLPFEAESAVSVAIMQLQKDPVMPREINDSIPVGLEQITMHAMQKDVLKRYKSAAEMLRDLEEFRRSPDMVFDYTYFIDEEPTRFVDVVNSATNNNYPFVLDETVNTNTNNNEPSNNLVSYDEDDEETQEKSPVIPILAGVAIAFILVTVIAGIFVFKYYFSSKTQGVIVPDFKGMIYSEVVEDSRYSEFNFNPQYVYSDTVPLGEIISQSKVGRTIKITEQIDVVISKGPETIKIPNVKGLNVQDAKMKLSTAGLKYKEIRSPSSTVSVDYVIMTNPLDGGDVPQGYTVDLYVSSGPDKKYNTVEKYTSLTKNAAVSKIEDAGFVCEIVERNDGSPKDVVIEQSAEPGTRLEKGSTITIYVGTGILEYEYKLVIKDDILGLTFKNKYKDMKLILEIDGTAKGESELFDANVREGEIVFKNIITTKKSLVVNIDIEFKNGEVLENALTYVIDMEKGEIESVQHHNDIKSSNNDSKYLDLSVPSSGNTEET